ncbi:hypothetical protein Cus16_0182 [Curtobacterium sp. ER1/6]|nr:hypothetical protein Cus16_0182 [Curtobacterium sp. ER1/6]
MAARPSSVTVCGSLSGGDGPVARSSRDRRERWEAVVGSDPEVRRQDLDDVAVTDLDERTGQDDDRGTRRHPERRGPRRAHHGAVRGPEVVDHGGLSGRVHEQVRGRDLGGRRRHRHQLGSGSVHHAGRGGPPAHHDRAVEAHDAAADPDRRHARGRGRLDGSGREARGDPDGRVAVRRVHRLEPRLRARDAVAAPGCRRIAVATRTDDRVVGRRRDGRPDPDRRTDHGVTERIVVHRAGLVDLAGLVDRAGFVDRAGLDVGPARPQHRVRHRGGRTVVVALLRGVRAQHRVVVVPACRLTHHGQSTVDDPVRPVALPHHAGSCPDRTARSTNQAKGSSGRVSSACRARTSARADDPTAQAHHAPSASAPAAPIPTSPPTAPSARHVRQAEAQRAPATRRRARSGTGPPPPSAGGVGSRNGSKGTTVRGSGSSHAARNPTRAKRVARAPHAVVTTTARERSSSWSSSWSTGSSRPAGPPVEGATSAEQAARRVTAAAISRGQRTWVEECPSLVEVMHEIVTEDGPPGRLRSSTCGRGSRAPVLCRIRPARAPGSRRPGPSRPRCVPAPRRGRAPRRRARRRRRRPPRCGRASPPGAPWRSCSSG